MKPTTIPAATQTPANTLSAMLPPFPFKNNKPSMRPYPAVDDEAVDGMLFPHRPRLGLERAVKHELTPAPGHGILSDTRHRTLTQPKSGAEPLTAGHLQPDRGRPRRNDGGKKLRDQQRDQSPGEAENREMHSPAGRPGMIHHDTLLTK
jgi:hypothetical protein